MASEKKARDKKAKDKYAKVKKVKDKTVRGEANLGKPKVNYKVCTQVVAPVRDFRTGQTLVEAGAGGQYIDLITPPVKKPVRLKHEVRVKYEPQPLPPRRSETPDVKSEDEDDEDDEDIAPATPCPPRAATRPPSPTEDSSSSSDEDHGGDGDDFHVFNKSSRASSRSLSTKSQSQSQKEQQVIADAQSSALLRSQNTAAQTSLLPQLPTLVPTPRPQPVVSPLSERVGGWNPINKKWKVVESGSSGKQAEQHQDNILKPSSSTKLNEQRPKKTLETSSSARDIRLPQDWNKGFEEPMTSATQRELRKTVFVCNIPWEMSDDHMRELLSTAGQLVAFQHTLDPETGRRRGFGLARYKFIYGATTAIQDLCDYEVMGRRLRLKPSRCLLGSPNRAYPDPQFFYAANMSSLHPQEHSGTNQVLAVRPRTATPQIQPSATSSRQHRAATAGPSTLSSPPQTSSAQSTGTDDHESTNVKALPSWPTPPGKGKAVATAIVDQVSASSEVDKEEQPTTRSVNSKKRQRVDNPDDTQGRKKKKRADKDTEDCVVEPADDKHEKKRKKSKKSNVFEECEVKMADLETLVGNHEEHPVRRGPPRSVGVVRAIEDDPRQPLLTPKPSSEGHSTSPAPSQLFDRASSGLFVTSPMQASSSSPPALQQSVSPIASTSPSFDGLSQKRRHSTVDIPALADSVGYQILDSMKAFLQTEAGRQAMELREQVSELTTRVLAEQRVFNQGIDQQLLEQRAVQELHEKKTKALVSKVRCEGSAKRNHLRDAIIKQDTRFTTLTKHVIGVRDKFQEQIDGQALQLTANEGKMQTQYELSERLQASTDRQDARLQALDTQAEVQTAYSSILDRKINTHDGKIKVLTCRTGDLYEGLDAARTRIDGHGQHLDDFEARIDNDFSRLDARTIRNTNTIAGLQGLARDQSHKSDVHGQRLSQLQQKFALFEHDLSRLLPKLAVNSTNAVGIQGGTRARNSSSSTGQRPTLVQMHKDLAPWRSKKEQTSTRNPLAVAQRKTSSLSRQAVIHSATANVERLRPEIPSLAPPPPVHVQRETTSSVQFRAGQPKSSSTQAQSSSSARRLRQDRDQGPAQPPRPSDRVAYTPGYHISSSRK